MLRGAAAAAVAVEGPERRESKFDGRQGKARQGYSVGFGGLVAGYGIIAGRGADGCFYWRVRERGGCSRGTWASLGVALASQELVAGQGEGGRCCIGCACSDRDADGCSRLGECESLCRRRGGEGWVMDASEALGERMRTRRRPWCMRGRLGDFDGSCLGRGRNAHGWWWARRGIR